MDAFSSTVATKSNMTTPFGILAPLIRHRFSKTLTAIFIGLFAFLLTPVVYAAAPQCVSILQLQPSKDFLLADDQLTDSLKDLIAKQSLAGDTTSLRKEDKFVISRTLITPLLNKLSESFGESFQLRDKKLEGKKNITFTKYAKPVRFNLVQGKNLSAKLRFRKYFTADVASELRKENLTAADFVKDRQFIELKIDHPEHQNVVIKPRLMVLDIDAELIQNKNSYRKQRTELLERAKEMNKKVDSEIVEAFFKVIDGIHNVAEKSSIPPFAETAYVRDSYSILVANPTGEKPIEVQLTIDAEVTVSDIESGKRIKAYKPSDAVVEVKVPLQYAALTPEILSNVPQLQIIKDLKDFLAQSHDTSRFKVGAGKLSTSRKARQNPDLLEMVE